jgi:beta-1,4-N-acetylglucosaminyltransferase
LKKKVLFISSTGGHFNELMQLKPMFEKYDYHIITEKDKTNKDLVQQYEKKIYFLPYGTRSKIFSYIIKYFYLCMKTVFLYLKLRPKYIVTTGTHTAGPMCYLGKLFGSKIIYIETFANSNTKTVTGRLIYPIADLFIVQWKEMLKLYPKAVYGGSIY